MCLQGIHILGDVHLVLAEIKGPVDNVTVFIPGDAHDPLPPDLVNNLVGYEDLTGVGDLDLLSGLVFRDTFGYIGFKASLVAQLVILRAVPTMAY